jgi:hypothetical protein
LQKAMRMDQIPGTQTKWVLFFLFSAFPFLALAWRSLWLLRETGGERPAANRRPKNAVAQCPIRQPQHLWTSIQLCCPSIGRLSLRSAGACVRMSHHPLCRVHRMEAQIQRKQVETNNKPSVCKEASCGRAKTREICLGQCWV